MDNNNININININNNINIDSVLVVGVGDDDHPYGYETWRATVSYSLAGLCLTVFLVTLVFLVVVATTRKFTYNLYIVFLLLPDALLNLVLGIRCLYDGIRNSGGGTGGTGGTGGGGLVLPMPLCVFQQIGISLYVSNLFLNAIVAKELYTLVWNSYHRKRTKPPTSQTILWQVALVYSLTSIFTIWQVLPVEWAEKRIENDPYCAATSRIPPWLSALVYALLIAPPVTVVLYVYNRMTRGKLLPRSGRTRVLTMYFMRIFWLFLLFYTPVTIVLSYYVTFDRDRRHSDAYFWLLEAFTILNPIQSTISLVVFWQKDDIQQKFYRYTRTSFSYFSVDRIDAAATATAENTKVAPKSAWKEHDTYERTDGGVTVVKYSIDDEEDDDDDDDDYEEEEDMPMWMSTAATEQVVSMTENTESMTESPIQHPCCSAVGPGDDTLAERRVVSLSQPAAREPWAKEAFRRIFPMLSKPRSRGDDDHHHSEDDDEEKAVASSWF